MRTFPFLMKAAGLAAALATVSAFALSPAELKLRLESGEKPLVVDLRAVIDYQRATVPGAIHLPHQLVGKRELPKDLDIVLVADGYGVVDAAAAASALRTAGYSRVEVLEGGFAAWQASAGTDTRAPGLSREYLPGLTYKQAIGAKERLAILDLRPAGTGSRKRASDAKKPDPVGAFAAKLNGARVLAIDDSKVRMRSASGKQPEPDTVSLANAGVAAAKGIADSLILIVADDLEAANEAARRLRTAGNVRFAILTGGVEAIEREGEVGLDRQGSSLNSLQPQP